MPEKLTQSLKNQSFLNTAWTCQQFLGLLRHQMKFPSLSSSSCVPQEYRIDERLKNGREIRWNFLDS
jgi:hypothetical protein